MLHVLRHYFPLRKALLVFSETILLTVVVAAGMSSHLWRPTDAIVRALAQESLAPIDALWRTLFSAFVVAVLAQVAISFNELYDFRISRSRYERAARFLGSAGSAVLLVTLAVGLFALWGAERLLHFPGLPFTQTVVMLTVSLIVAFALLYLWRHAFHAFLLRTRFNERLLVLGSGRLAQRLTDELLSRDDSGYRIVARVAPATPGGEGERRRGDRRERRGSDGPSGGTGNPWFEAGAAAQGPLALRSEAPPETTRVPRLVVEQKPGTAESPSLEPPKSDESLHELALRLDVDDVVVAFEERRGSLPTEELLRCRLDGIVVEEAEAFYERLTGKIPAEAMRPSYLIFNPGFLQHPLAQVAKRTLDFVLALLGLALAFPVMLAAALAIRLDSPGPILFRQQRTGLRGDPFTLLKFRSMRTDAERETGPVWAKEDDPRITRVGRFIRRTRIDEIPQLLNVLGGSMSLVGPRPERPEFVAELAEKLPYYHQRHTVKPGITGWAQINYPYGNTVEDALQKLQYDLFYIKYQSLLFDLSIVFNTVKTVVLRKGT